MNPKEELKRRLDECPLVAIIRGVTPGEAEAVGDAIYEAGIRIIEVPLHALRLHRLRRLHVHAPIALPSADRNQPESAATSGCE